MLRSLVFISALLLGCICSAIALNSGGSSSLQNNQGRKAPYVFLGARAKHVLKKLKKHESLRNFPQSSNVRYQLKRAQMKTRRVFKDAKAAYESLEGHKLLVKHTQKELVDLDKAKKKKLNSRGLRLEKT